MAAEEEGYEVRRQVLFLLCLDMGYDGLLPLGIYRYPEEARAAARTCVEKGEKEAFLLYALPLGQLVTPHLAEWQFEDGWPHDRKVAP